ncbi:MAG: phenylalanine--tRNA ligase subunit beta [Candidatus Curtissbacteria bacterium]|nr:phenylalanine--tRNA ligase subunit beta [Candidatus Curtissbacteria bacterium]
MNITVPVSWLREYLKTDVAAKTLANYLTLAGPSVERIQKHGTDLLLEVEVTTNRPDAFSVFGLAREANTILNFENQKSSLVHPKGLNTKLDPDTKDILALDVLIKDKSLCPRFTAIILDNVKIKPSPAEIKNRLEASGIRAINNIVDISNYVMLELGQPMHTFDFDKIKGSKMILREAKEGEKLKTLDGQTRSLPKGTIVIEDGQRLIDLCGIMGGENSQISLRTKRVLIFVQAYDPIRIRKTTQALAFRTDAATRFGKGIDLEGILPALSRAVYLAKKTAGAKIASELIDIYRHPPAGGPKTIHLSLQKLDQYLGITLEPARAARILTLLGFTVSVSAQTITATAPSWRTQDMNSQEDLIEEIARIYGYHRLPSKLPEGEVINEKESDLSKVISLKEALKFLGLTEIISYSIISKELLALTGVQPLNAVELANPLSQEWQFMRPTNLVSLAAIIGQNQNLHSDMKLFEIAKTYIKNGDNLPTQNLYLSIALQNADSAKQNFAFYKVKGIVENIFEALGREVKFEKPKQNPLFIKDQSADIITIGPERSRRVGALGILSPSITTYFGIDVPVAACEINLTTVYSLPTTAKNYRPIPKYPPVIEDISAIFDKETLIADIIKEVKKAGAPLIKQIEIIDIYTDEKLGADKKSITLRLYYQKSDGTPNAEAVEKIRDAIQIELIKNLKAQIRK